MRAHQKVWLEHHGWLPDWKGKREIIHHKDGDKLNNSIENLEVMTQAEHVRLHKPRKGKRFTPEQRAVLSAKKIGNNYASGKKHSDETKRRMSEKSKDWHSTDEARRKMASRKRDEKGKFQ